MFLLRQKYDNMNAEAAEQDQSLYMSRLILLYTREREREREIERERERGYRKHDGDLFRML